MSKLSSSPFHQGEKKIQQRLGCSQQMEDFGRRVIRDYMPDQHREFYRRQSYIFAGFADASGQPWASILFNPAGFIQSPDAKTLLLSPQLLPFDPLRQVLQQAENELSQVAHPDIALLGIELATRRRNRVSMRLVQSCDNNIKLTLKQSFGNCPQYIQSRLLMQSLQVNPAATVLELTQLNQAAQDLISRSDTFFVASILPTKQACDEVSGGADISHRGGKPGFVRIDNNRSLSIPDYAGNNHFNTLGNLIENPKAGLLFIDFESGDVLSLSGTTEVLLDSDEIAHFKGAERLWKFHLKQGFYAKAVLQGQWLLDSYSLNTQLTGTWAEAKQQAELAQQKSQFENYNIVAIEDQSSSIRSFYLAPQSGFNRQFESGQFITLKAEINGKQEQRCYSLSSAPSDENYRISVKKDGVFSAYLHALTTAQSLQVLPAEGRFVYDLASSKPALMLAAGIGITPFLSMLRESVSHAIAKRYWRPAILIISLPSLAELSFVDEVNQLLQYSEGRLSVFYCFSRLLQKPSPEQLQGAKLNADNCFNRRLDQSLLAQILKRCAWLDDIAAIEAHLCGPASFMQAAYDALLALGMDDKAVLAEAFGPASLQREQEKLETAEDALISFSDTKGQELMALNWLPEDGSLLNFALKHGLEPNYSCQQGVCGSCKGKKLKGELVYKQSVSPALVESLADNEVLLCCALPAPNSKEVQVQLLN